MKTKTYPIFHIDGRRARTLRKELGMPRDLKDLDEDSATEITQVELALVAETLNLPRLKYDHLAGPDAFLCGGALTAWIGGYLPSDYDFFVPTLELAERLHHRLLYQGAVLDGYQGTEAGTPIYDAIQKGELHIDELVVENEEIRALNYSMPTNARASRCYRPARSGLQPRPSISNCPLGGLTLVGGLSLAMLRRRSP
jgi:hypothetical protein